MHLQLRKKNVSLGCRFAVRRVYVARSKVAEVGDVVGPVTWHDPKSVAAEAYRILRTNLQFTNPDRPLRSILITSPTVGDGKSTVAANLAVSFAQVGCSVIIVNADLRRPSVHKMFQVPDGVGLTSVLVGQATVKEALRETHVPNVRLLTAGPTPPNPAELLESKRMLSVMEELKEHADIILYDAPPVTVVTDAGLLAPHVDGCVLVVSVGVTQREMARVALEQLHRVGGRILGVVVNRVHHGSGYYYYYYYSAEDKSLASGLRKVWRRVRSRFGKKAKR